MLDLRVGAMVLLEAIEIQKAKDEKFAASLKSKKDEEAARVELVRYLFDCLIDYLVFCIAGEETILG